MEWNPIKSKLKRALSEARLLEAQKYPFHLVPMARKKDSRKSSALSEEYIVDSDSDGPAEADSSNQTISNNAVAASATRKKQKSEKITSSRLIALTESPRSDGSVDGEDDVMEVFSSSSGGSSHGEESESETNAEATPNLQKKKPPKVNGTSV
jgi:hypothetical protein